MGTDPDDEIERTILALVAARGPQKTICPSEAARALSGEAGFRARMDAVREIAFTLADHGSIEITQRGEVVDGRSARGPIRLRRARGVAGPSDSGRTG